MPAAAVIPAPIAYIKVAAVKKLVVGSAASCQAVHLPGGYCLSDQSNAAVSMVLFTECHRRPERLL